MAGKRKVLGGAKFRGGKPTRGAGLGTTETSMANAATGGREFFRVVGRSLRAGLVFKIEFHLR